MSKKDINHEKVTKEVESSLSGIGLEWKIEGNKIILDPDKLTFRASSIVGKIQNFSTRIFASVKVSQENESLKEEWFTRLYNMQTPIKLRIIGNIVLCLVFIIILFVMLKHIWNYFYSVAAVSVLVLLLTSMMYIFLRLVALLTKSDYEILSGGGVTQNNGKYEIQYDAFFKELKKQKVWAILFSAMLLASFCSGIIFNSGLLNYISGVADSLGYIFAILFLILSSPRKKSFLPVVSLIFLFTLFEVKTITNSDLLNFIFIMFDTFLYISFFVYSLYCLFYFKKPPISQLKSS